MVLLPVAKHQIQARYLETLWTSCVRCTIPSVCSPANNCNAVGIFAVSTTYTQMYFIVSLLSQLA